MRVIKGYEIKEPEDKDDLLHKYYLNGGWFDE